MEIKIKHTNTRSTRRSILVIASLLSLVVCTSCTNPFYSSGEETGPNPMMDDEIFTPLEPIGGADQTTVATDKYGTPLTNTTVLPVTTQEQTTTISTNTPEETGETSTSETSIGGTLPDETNIISDTEGNSDDAEGKTTVNTEVETPASTDNIES